MLDFLIIYIAIAITWLILALVVSIKDCKELNAALSRECYRVNYKGCFLKSFLFPLTLASALAEYIKSAMNDEGEEK